MDGDVGSCVVGVAEAKCQLLHDLNGIQMGMVHFPVAADQRFSAADHRQLLAFCAFGAPAGAPTPASSAAWGPLPHARPCLPLISGFRGAELMLGALSLSAPSALPPRAPPPPAPRRLGRRTRTDVKAFPTVRQRTAQLPDVGPAIVGRGEV